MHAESALKNNYGRRVVFIFRDYTISHGLKMPLKY